MTVDASFDHTTGTTGVGILVQATARRRRRGKLLDRITETHHGIPSGSGEAFAILRALQIAACRGFSHVRVRSDYNLLRRRLRAQHRRGVPSAHELDRQILLVSEQFVSVDFRYVPRHKNGLAHGLARRARHGETVDAHE